MLARIGGKTITIPDNRVRADGGAVKLQAHAPYGVLAAPSPTYPYKSKLEAAMARTLEFDRLAGLIKGWRYEPVRFLLPGERNTYKIDFCVWGYEGESRPVFIEVKGRNRSDDRSLVKQKTAAGLNPWAKFLLMKRVRGMWVEREIKA